MNSLMFKYPLDYNGTNPQNGVTIPVKLPVGNPNRAEALPYGPMFADTVRVTEAGKPSTPLTRGKDYQLIITNPELIKRCRGREIVHGIVIFNEKISDQIVIGGQIVGGPYGTNLEAIEQIVDAINADTRKIKWSDLRNVPDEYLAAPAYYDIGDVYGFEYIIMAMGQIEQAIRLKDNAEMVRIQEMIAQMREELLTMFKTHVDAEGNVHNLTRTQLNVYSTGQVDNIFSEAINRFNTLMVELGKLDNVDKTLSQRIDGVVTSTSNYISQIVESNLEHQKNTLEIARVSGSVADVNKRINDAIKEIDKNKADIKALQDAFTDYQQSTNQQISEINNTISKLGDNYVSRTAVNENHSTAAANVFGKIPVVNPQGAIMLGNRLSLRQAGTTGATMYDITLYDQGFYFGHRISVENYFLRSDRRYKENIRLIKESEAFGVIDHVRAFTYNFKDSGLEGTGVIAQQLEEVYPRAVSTNIDPTNNKPRKHVDPMALIALLFTATRGIVRKLKTVDELKTKVKQLERKVARLEKKG